MRHVLAIVLALTSAMPAWAQKVEDDEEPSDEEATEEEEEESGEATPSGTGKDAAQEAPPAEDTTDQALRPKQNLTGHDLGTKKRENEFERDRFFVDKVDSEKTEEGTLIQGSLASSSFFYAESGGQYDGGMIGDNVGPARFFTELRLQTDFRHIAGSRWEARVDARARFVNSPPNAAQTSQNNIQSGLNGKNEYDIRELWLIRAGKRTDFFFGRQYIPDLGGMKIDGLRFDYAQSAKFTVIAFGGLFPLRGSRSLDTDYVDLKTETGQPAGKIVTTGGGGVAYRTINTYGAVGGVAQVPLQGEQARVFATSNGYFRGGSKLDFYHLLLVDLIGSAAADSSIKVQFTNASFGVNFKPDQRLRLTASFHHVDTETLSVQAGAFLNQVDTSAGGNPVVQNEAYIVRLATNLARASVSAGLGKQQRFEISTAGTWRNRPQFALVTPDAMTADIVLPAANSIEVWASFVDRRFFFDTRVGIDGSRAFKIGDLAFQRSISELYRVFVSRLIQDGRGEWEAEISYSGVADTLLGMMGTTGCSGNGALVVDCYGTSSNTILSATGQLFYRISDSWFGIGNLSAMRITNKRSDLMNEDPAVLGFTGFVRIAKRF